MSRTHGSLTRKVAYAALITLGLTSVASAQTATQSSGLGQSWPNATNVSANPKWRVYVFTLNGIKYVQVNDLNGTVHAAIGTAGDVTIVLPVGVDAKNVATPLTTSTSTAETVYSDSTIAITAVPQGDGATLFTATPVATSSPCTGGPNCGGGRGN